MSPRLFFMVSPLRVLETVEDLPDDDDDDDEGDDDEEQAKLPSLAEIARKSFRKNNIAEWLTSHMAIKAMRKDLGKLWMLHPEVAEAITPCFDAKLDA
uniref:Uncharacterized protein n=1 Tax=Lotharella oceanica TaxID=641309 RepID=A0A7S2U2T2_9EUKA